MTSTARKIEATPVAAVNHLRPHAPLNSVIATSECGDNFWNYMHETSASVADVEHDEYFLHQRHLFRVHDRIEVTCKRLSNRPVHGLLVVTGIADRTVSTAWLRGPTVVEITNMSPMDVLGVPRHFSESDLERCYKSRKSEYESSDVDEEGWAALDAAYVECKRMISLSSMQRG